MGQQYPFPCFFDENRPSASLKPFNKLAKSEDCDHIRRVTSKTGGYDLYVLMDSNCHQQHPNLSPCNKPESPYLRLILHWTGGKSTTTKPRAVTCMLTSLRQDLLRFHEGEVNGVMSILDLVHKPLWLTTIYRKAEKVHCRVEDLSVEKTPGLGLKRAPVEIDVLLWKEYPKIHNGTQKAHLEIAVPLTARVETALHREASDNSNKSSTESTPQLTEEEILNILTELIPGQFDKLISRLKVPRSDLSSDSAPQSKRSDEIILWVKGQEDKKWVHLLEELRKLVPGKFKSNQP